VYRRSLSSSPNAFRTEVPSGQSRLARTPPSTFLFLLLHLSNSPGPKTQLPEGSLEAPTGRQITTDDDRLLIHSSSWGASPARKHALAMGQDSAALSGRVISPASAHCQRSSSTNRRIGAENFAVQISPDFSGSHAVQEPQSCDVLTVR